MSPMMDALEISIEQMDGKVLEELIPRLVTIIRKGVGLPTKAGSARFVVSMCVRIPEDLRPHSDALLKALSGAISDRSAVVRKSFAAACGYTAHLASEPALKRFVSHLTKMSLESEDDDTRSIPAITFLETARRARSELDPFIDTLLPLAFLGARDRSQALREIWLSVFNELTVASTSSALQLYGSEIMLLFKSLLSESPSWMLKRQVGLAIADMAKTVDKEFSKFMGDSVSMLIEALGGRTWEGKEDVVKALSTVCVVGKDWFKNTGKEKLSEVSQILIREAKKNNKEYKPHSIEAMGDAFEALDVDHFALVWEYLISIVKNEHSDDDDNNKMDVDGSVNLSARREGSPQNVLRQKAVAAVGKCWPSAYDTQ
ncbi:proteasome component M29, partial [Nowakowskiella sp. JEL0078]